MNETKAQKDQDTRRDWTAADLAPILEALRGLRYGSVELIIQDYRLIQIDRNEKIRPSRS